MDSIQWTAGTLTDIDAFPGALLRTVAHPGLRRWGGMKRALLGVVLGALFSVITAAAADPAESDAARRVAAILEQIKSRYVEPIDDKKLIADAVNGVLKNLDPHSSYLDLEAFRQVQEDSRGVYGGVGVEVGMDGGAVKVLSAFEDTPAFHAGLAPGDLITRVENASVEGMNLQQVIRRVRGEPDTDVVLTLVRRGEPGPRTITLTRETIQGRSVTAKLIEPGYLYVRITQFQTRTAEMMAREVERLMEAGEDSVAGIILDLRDNPGGVLRAAVGVSAAFLRPDAPIVFTNGAAKDSKMRLSAKRTDYLRHSSDDYLDGLSPLLKSLPMVVLVNGDSASAAEIVAGALQDNNRALVLGTRTYGKGSIQVIIPFGDGTGLRLTTAYYYTPSGRLIQGKGVTPDIVVEEKFSANTAVSDVRPVVLGSRTIEPKVEADPAVCAMHSGADVAPATDQVDAADRRQVAPFSGDCQLEHALLLLRSRTSMIHSRGASLQ